MNRRCYLHVNVHATHAYTALSPCVGRAVQVHQDWRLNERMYGGLTGLNKKETVAKYGEDQVKQWRRSFSTPPPPIEKDSPYWPGARTPPTPQRTHAHLRTHDRLLARMQLSTPLPLL
eukprot:6178086-Pleurochrysis_carterae.AAC.3